MKHKLLSILLTLLVPVCAAYAQTTHWQLNLHDYEYDMTAYVSLKYYSKLSNYEIAAFCGEECRGVAEIMEAGKGQIGYLRIRSNVASGEIITFKVFIKDKQEEVDLDSDPVSFASNATLGAPSNPFQLQIPGAYLPGDVNGDGEVTVYDITRIVNYILTGEDTNFNYAAADMNDDGEVTVFDITQIVSIILKND